MVIRFVFQMANGALSHAPRGHEEPAGEDREEAVRLWSRHVDALAKLEAEYTAFEIDPSSAFRRRLLADVSEPQTAAFHDVLRRAQDLRTEEPPSSRRLVDEFGDAVHAAGTAWRIADRHARNIAVPTPTDSERRRLRQAEDALQLALDERTSSAERRVALERVEHLIRGLTSIEPAARTSIFAELDHLDRREITQ
ncbi:hypothetical protein ACTHRK_16675 [Dietzia cercidiphylli]|uniref:hypothetical protein n=1 Tax=Dietzia cercidiphylli TaxID=498199 RepID=UPI003F81AA59